MSKKPTNPTSVLEIGSSEWVEYLIEDAMQKHNEAAAAKRKSKVTTPEANNNNSVVKCPSCKKV